MNVDEKEFFREATIRICGSLEIEKALFDFFTYVRDLIPADQICLNFYDPDSRSIQVHAMADDLGGRLSDLHIPLKPKMQALINDRELFPDLVIANRNRADTLPRTYLAALGRTGASLLVMRLWVEGELQGTVCLLAEGHGRYRPEHLHLVGLLKDPWAIALSNSRRYQELLGLQESLADDNKYFQDEMRSLSGARIVGADGGLAGVLRLVSQVAPLESPVLILGETGVGKEVVAGHIHDLSARRDGPFIKVNCGAIPGTLLDSELFGHEKGAFTGALSRQRGRFERAHGGTIFLDEVGELSREAQVRLLRVLQEKEIERVGGTTVTKVDIRVIAATHRNLEEMVGSGAFRQDLYYRLKVFPIVIPPLRERKEDIGELVPYFVRRKAMEMGRFQAPEVAPGAMDRLMAHHWPGNVRELENTIERAMILCQEGALDFEGIVFPTSPQKVTGRLRNEPANLSLDQAVRRHIRKAMAVAQGRIEGKGGAAELLEINPGTLRYRMRKLGIPFGRRANPDRS